MQTGSGGGDGAQKLSNNIHIESQTSEKIRFYKRLKLTIVLIINFIASLSLILSNKYIFKIWNIHPVKLVCFHLFCTTTDLMLQLIRSEGTTHQVR